MQCSIGVSAGEASRLTTVAGTRSWQYTPEAQPAWKPAPPVSFVSWLIHFDLGALGIFGGTGDSSVPPGNLLGGIWETMLSGKLPASTGQWPVLPR